MENSNSLTSYWHRCFHRFHPHGSTKHFRVILCGPWMSVYAAFHHDPSDSQYLSVSERLSCGSANQLMVWQHHPLSLELSSLFSMIPSTDTQIPAEEPNTHFSINDCCYHCLLQPTRIHVIIANADSFFFVPWLRNQKSRQCPPPPTHSSTHP